ncbi:MAG: mandelate racemase/muconate lactonizing enzyme family protein [Opitutae bacterium]|nr:mandelate racemase/muconate lactonizing enzyme family protein [Opitutae bacterium]
MIIESVEPHLLSCPLPQPVCYEFHGGRRTVFKRDALVVAVRGEKGLVGFGPAAASEEMAKIIVEGIAPLLVGNDLCGPAGFVSLATSKLGSETLAAAGAVEVALYDLWGKLEGCSVTEFLGGRKQETVCCYGSAGMYQSAESYAQEAASVCELGFSAYKYRPALGPGEDLRTVELMRQAVGPDVGLCLDAHGWWRMGDKSYDASTIETLARDIAPFGITWLEEPLPLDDRAAYAELKAKEIVPIAAGEHEHDLAGFKRLVESGSVDIAQADVSHHGGFSGVAEIIRLCESNEVTFAFHNWGTALETVVDALIGSCFRRETARWLEYPQYAHRDPRVMYPFPLSDELVPDAPVPEKGELSLPEGPGLGVTVDESVFEKYPYLPGPWSIFELESPPTKLALSGDHALPWAEDSS